MGLRKAGFKVRVLHFRVADHRILGGVYPLGGKTEVYVTTPNGEDFQGAAICSKKERFNKKMGVSIALGRALSGN
jgi:hypothetical protein